MKIKCRACGKKFSLTPEQFPRLKACLRCKAPADFVVIEDDPDKTPVVPVPPVGQATPTAQTPPAIEPLQGGKKPIPERAPPPLTLVEPERVPPIQDPVGVQGPVVAPGRFRFRPFQPRPAGASDVARKPRGLNLVFLAGAVMVVVGFALPWVDFGIFEISGYQIPSKVNAIAGAFASKSGEEGRYELLYLMYAMPVLFAAAVISELQPTRAGAGSFILKLLAIVSVPVSFSIWSQGRDIFAHMAFGAYVTIFGDVVAFAGTLRGSDNPASSSGQNALRRAAAAVIVGTVLSIVIVVPMLSRSTGQLNKSTGAGNSATTNQTTQKEHEEIRTIESPPRDGASKDDQTSEVTPETVELIEQLYSLDARTTAGISYRQYHELFVELKVAEGRMKRSIGSGSTKLSETLIDAVEDHRIADDVWRDKTDSLYGGAVSFFWGRLKDEAVNRYHLPTITKTIDGKPTECVKYATVIEAAWAAAKSKIDAARYR